MANLNLQDKKFITPENLRLIINYGLGFASRVKKLEDKEIAPFEADKLYTKDSLTIYDGYIYKAKVTNQSSTFNEIYWDLIGDDITELTKSDVEAMVGLSAEEIETLSKIILDSEIRLDKTFSSSKIYTDIQNAIQTSKDYTLTEVDNDFLKKTDADGKFATITTVDNHTSDTDIHTTATEKASYVKKTDIVDNLVDNSTDKPLSANQGNVLDTKIGHKIDNDKIVTTIDNTSTDEQIPSAKVTHNELSKKVDKTDITTTIDNTSTDEQIPSAKAVYNATVDKNLKTYTSIAQLGLTEGSETLSDIATNMSNNSVAILNVQSSCNVSEYPVGYGVLTVNKLNISRVSFIFTETGGASTLRQWFASYNGGKLNGWKRVCTTSVTDVAKTTITPVNSAITGTIEYVVKNGICYVSLFNVKTTTNDEGLSISTTMPKPAINCGSVIVTKGTRGNIGFVYINKDTTQLTSDFYVTDLLGSCSFSYPVAEE